MALRAYRTKPHNFTTGVNSTIDGGYYFDGHKMHVETVVQAATTATYPMGTSPIITAPTEMTMYATNYLGHKVLGTGLAHNAANGATCPIVAVQRNPWQVEIMSAAGGPFTTITGSNPFAWGALSGFRIDWSYRPATNAVPRNFTAYGDSITRYESNSLGSTWSWTGFVPNTELVFGGGFAVDSGTSAQVLAGAKPVAADVGVCMVGVNDIYQGVPVGAVLANVVALRAKIGTDSFVLCKIPPYDANPAAANALNDAYELLAYENGWTLADPFAAYRTQAGTWVVGASYDGVHPNMAPQQAAAAVIRDAIL